MPDKDGVLVTKDGLMRKTRHRGERRIGWMFVFTLAVHNLVRLRNLTDVWSTSPY